MSKHPNAFGFPIFTIPIDGSFAYFDNNQANQTNTQTSPSISSKPNSTHLDSNPNLKANESELSPLLSNLNEPQRHSFLFTSFLKNNWEQRIGILRQKHYKSFCSNLL